MKIKRLCTMFFLFTLTFATLGISGCNGGSEEPVKELVVSYYDDDVMVSRKKYTSEEDFKLLELEAREGMVFAGWYLEATLENKFDASKLSEYFAKGRISLYSSWKLKENDFAVETHGLVDGKSAINPLFTWDNVYGDSRFTVTITKNGQEIAKDLVFVNYYASKVLESNTEYTFSLEGKESGNVQEVSFTTMDVAGFDTSKEVVLNDPFMSNMVLQREEVINLSGVGPEKTLISVAFGSEIYCAYSDEEGNFNVEVEPHAASFDPIEIKVGLGIGEELLTNVLIGDVFFFSGQSNMQWPTSSSDYKVDDANKAKANSVRFFTQSVIKSDKPLEHVTNGKWFTVNNNNYLQYSAIALMTGSFLGEYLKDQNVPVGILSAYQGDTNIANWMSKDYYTGKVSTKHLHYNAMVHPLRHATVKGVVWYQGCNNSAAGGDYKELLKAYFANYRDLFDDEDLPFYVIGLACYDGDSGNNYDFSYVRESQAKACAEDANAYYISSCDDGDPTFIHPTAKRYIAQRVAKSIMSSLYGFSFLAEGPSYKSHTVSGNTVTIELNNAEGLKSDGAIHNLLLAGEDGKYYEAEAKIVKQTIVASSDKVANPVYIKYGFGKSPFVNIYNKDGFSMVPFRTDEYNKNIDLLDYNSLETYTFHPDGSKMNISYANNGLNIVKTNDGKAFGSVRVEKWGMIAYNPTGLRITVVGTNSNAKVTFRAIEGPSYEGWGYEFTDNFVGEKTFELSMSDIKPLLNQSDTTFNVQAISYIEIVINANTSAEITFTELRFV